MSLQNLSILLVEDDEDDYLLTREYLEEIFGKSFHLDWFHSSKDALQAIQSLNYDVALVDYFIGADNGIDLTKVLHQTTHAILPVILLTGNDSANADKLAIEAGAEDYILKQDLNPTILKASIRNAIIRRNAKTQLSESETRLRMLMRSIPDGIIMFNQAGIVQSCNQAMLHLLDSGEQDIIGLSISTLLTDTDRILNEKQDRFTTTIQNSTGKAIPVEVSMNVYQLGGKSYHVCVIRDITEQLQAQSKIERMAHYDNLTDLPNRRLLMDRLEHAANEAKRHGYYGALMFCDLDRFKHLNDSLGHAVGDELLQKVARRLENALRDVDTVARIGGDEFVILLDRLDETEKRTIISAHKVAKKIQRALNKPYKLKDAEFHFSASIGIAVYPYEDDADVENILKNADTAMYRAKSEGRNEIRFYHSSIQSETDSRLTLEEELRNAIANNEFDLVYQPQLDANCELLGCESLLRWHHPTRGTLYPEQFIAAAEDSGLIVPIGKKLLEIALEQKAELFENASGSYMSINVSPIQFRQRDFIKCLKELMRAHPNHRGQLVFEITENLLLDDINDSINRMMALNAMGIKISIDDFGTGYSSLAYLKNLPIHQLKIDKSFIIGISKDKNNQAIVEAIIAMANKLGIQVVAEGVEDQASFETLLAAGCEVFQGFHFGMPLYADDFKQLIDRKTTKKFPPPEKENLSRIS